MPSKRVSVMALADMQKGQLAVMDPELKVANPIADKRVRRPGYGLLLVKAVGPIRRGRRGSVELIETRK